MIEGEAEGAHAGIRLLLSGIYYAQKIQQNEVTANPDDHAPKFGEYLLGMMRR